MLQVPALLEEDGSMAGIENRYIVCCTYFYLSLVRKLQGDEWPMTMHFLQSVLVFPQLVRRELAPGLWRSLFGSLVAIGDKEEAVEGSVPRWNTISVSYQPTMLASDRLLVALALLPPFPQLPPLRPLPLTRFLMAASTAAPLLPIVATYHTLPYASSLLCPLPRHHLQPGLRLLRPVEL